jgi:hypothetical protein
MATKKLLLGVYDDELTLLEAVRKVRSAGVRIHEVFTPFPVHGMDEAMGNRPTGLHTAGFFFGLTGVALMLLYITWISTINYPTIFGGKPYFSLPAYVPILFEVTVLSASVGMVVVYFVLNGLSPIKQKPVLDERITDDKFIIAVSADDLATDERGEISDLLRDNGAVEINDKVLEF